MFPQSLDSGREVILNYSSNINKLLSEAISVVSMLRAVLIVEDDAGSRFLVAAALNDIAKRIVVAADAFEALSLVGTGGSAIDLLITDVHLGAGPDGWELTRHIRHRLPELAVIYLTAAAPDEWAAEGVPKSIVLRKPCCATRLLAEVAQLNLAQNRPVFEHARLMAAQG